MDIENTTTLPTPDLNEASLVIRGVLAGLKSLENADLDRDERAALLWLLGDQLSAAQLTVDAAARGMPA